jgi:hypothetical protein
MSLQQSREEIFRVFQEWYENYAPANFDTNSPKNGKLVADYILETSGIVSITSINEAVKALWSALDLLPEAKPKTHAELANAFQAKERARIRKEAEDNIAKAKVFDNLALKDASSVEAKRQADAQKSIDALVARYSVNGSTPGTFDSKKTEAGRAALRAIRMAVNGKYDAVISLKFVQSAFHYDTVAEINAAVQRELGRVTGTDENTRRKADETKMGVGPGNLPRYH